MTDAAFLVTLTAAGIAVGLMLLIGAAWRATGRRHDRRHGHVAHLGAGGRRGPRQRDDRARRGDALSPLQSRTCVWYRSRIEAAGDDTPELDEERGIGFRVRDATGSIRVFPRGAHLDVPDRFDEKSGSLGDPPPGLDRRDGIGVCRDRGHRSRGGDRRPAHGPPAGSGLGQRVGRTGQRRFREPPLPGGTAGAGRPRDDPRDGAPVRPPRGPRRRGPPGPVRGSAGGPRRPGARRGDRGRPRRRHAAPARGGVGERRHRRLRDRTARPRAGAGSGRGGSGPRHDRRERRGSSGPSTSSPTCWSWRRRRTRRSRSGWGRPARPWRASRAGSCWGCWARSSRSGRRSWARSRCRRSGDPGPAAGSGQRARAPVNDDGATMMARR